jgi:micrococcal nuclease
MDDDHRRPPAALAAAAAWLAALAGQHPAVAETECGMPRPGMHEARLAAGLDGRSLATADGTVILLAGIDIPEPTGISGGTASVPELAAGVSIAVLPAGAADRHDRLPADVFLGGAWLQAELIARGVARVRPEGEAACAPALLAVERRARAAGRGLWSDRAKAVRSADDPSLSARNGLYELVEGRVVSVGYGSRMVFLDFGHDYRTDFTVMVPNSLLPRLAEAGIRVDRVEGRTLRVRGVIEEAGGPAIRVSVPAEIEVLDGAE